MIALHTMTDSPYMRVAGLAILSSVIINKAIVVIKKMSQRDETKKSI